MHSRTKLVVRYAETDRMGIVHHSNFPVWYEMGRSDYIKMFGTSYSEMENSGVMTPLRNLNCHFKLPAQYEDELIVRTWCTAITASRIEFSYTVKRIEPDESEVELGYGSTEHAFVDSKTFRPCSIRKRLPELYDKITNNIKHF
ncbi:MAG TPA: 4-hydroxybenzoyl-CoA thioesterase [Ruminococcus sp.]|nr:4-hydroxybenzoyl-CoA thioesterase [Ruminococcus sp.]